MSDPGYDADLDPEELAFQRLFGPWRALHPTQVAAYLGDFDGPWWVAGGWAVEAFTGVSRPHDDVDVSIFRRDLPGLCRALAGRAHVWSVGARALRPVDEHFPETTAEASQVWVREHALAPWLLDVLLNPDDGGRWVDRRWPEHVVALEEVTWTADDGVRYLVPEVALLFKARLHRPKDDADLAEAWPLLDTRQRTWLLDALAAVEPGHPWSERLSVDDTPGGGGPAAPPG